MKALVSMASDLLLDVPSWLNGTSACLTPAPWQIKVKPRSEVNKNITYKMNNQSNISDYEGSYGHPAFGQIHIKAAYNKSDLFLKFGRFGHMRLIPLEDKGEFWAEFIDRLWFVTGSDGKSSYYNVTFVYSKESNIIGLKFPVDSKYNRSLFTKNCQDSTISGLNQWCLTSSCRTMFTADVIILIITCIYYCIS